MKFTQSIYKINRGENKAQPKSIFYKESHPEKEELVPFTNKESEMSDESDSQRPKKLTRKM
jgi:hypothetical protein